MSNNNQQKIDFLIKSGLGSDINKLPFYRKVLMQPEAAVKSYTIYREYITELLCHLVHFLDDEVIYNRVRTLLIRRHHHHHHMSEQALKALIEKAVEQDVPVDILIDVYQRGFLEEGRQIDPDQNGFNRVNSFLSGGKALDLDRDLLDEYYIEEESKDKKKKKKSKPYNPTLYTIAKVMKNSACKDQDDK